MEEKIYKFVILFGRIHILVNVDRPEGVEPANYLGSGMALHAILKKGDTITNFQRRLQTNKIK